MGSLAGLTSSCAPPTLANDALLVRLPAGGGGGGGGGEMDGRCNEHAPSANGLGPPPDVGGQPFTPERPTPERPTLWLNTSAKPPETAPAVRAARAQREAGLGVRRTLHDEQSDARDERGQSGERDADHVHRVKVVAVGTVVGLFELFAVRKR